MKLNHRYPNKAYYTITKKNGRKLHKCGYPYFFDLDEQGNPFTAILLITVKGRSASGETVEVSTMFPLSVQLSEERPICGLSLRQNIEEGTFLFRSSKYCEDGGWQDLCWSNEQGTALTGEDFIPLILDADATEVFKNKCIVFATTLMPAPQKCEEIMIF